MITLTKTQYDAIYRPYKIVQKDNEYIIYRELGWANIETTTCICLNSVNAREVCDILNRALFDAQNE